MTIKDSIVDLLKEKTAAVQEVCAEIAKLEDQKKNGHLDAGYIAKVIDPQISELRLKRHNRKDEAEVALHKLAEEHRQAVLNSNRIKGEELTDDARLFTCGVQLKPEEIEAIMDRSAGNHTMLQLAQRYAQEHDIKINRVYDSGKAAEISSTNDLESAGKLYLDHWIDQSNAGDMLSKFFGGEAQ